MLKFITLFVLSFILLTTSYASHEMIIQVVQPVVREREIMDELIYTYIRYGNYISDLRVKLTCEENFIKTESGVVNRNIANIFGLKINFIGFPVYVDTLKAELILPEEETLPLDDYFITLEQVIDGTIQCMIKNAAVDRNLNYLDLKVLKTKPFSRELAYGNAGQ